MSVILIKNQDMKDKVYFMSGWGDLVILVLLKYNNKIILIVLFNYLFTHIYRLPIIVTKYINWTSNIGTKINCLFDKHPETVKSQPLVVIPFWWWYTWIPLLLLLWGLESHGDYSLRDFSPMGTTVAWGLQSLGGRVMGSNVTEE